MDRALAYTGQLLPASTLLQIAKDSLFGVSKLAEAIVGTSTQIYGFPCTPTGPASMQVNVGPGVIFSLQAADATAYGDLGTDSHQIVKQGVLSDAVTPSFTAPATAGQSVNFLIQIAFTESDTTTAVLPYYNSANPSVPFTGPGNTGTSQATRRQDVATVAVKAGTPATTGSQATPSPDAGYVGAWVVTVANGQTTITSGNIAKYSSAPFLTTSGLAGWINYVISAASMTPDATSASQLKSALDSLYTSLTAASDAVTQAGTSTTTAVTPASLAATMLGGVGQVMTDKTSSRSFGTTFTNSTGRPIAVFVTMGHASPSGAPSSYNIIVGGTSVGVVSMGDINGSSWDTTRTMFSFIVPNNTSYSVAYASGSAATLYSWTELQ